MTQRALVIGIESYPQCTSGLTGQVLPGAVADALHFYDWLSKDAGLAPDDIELHLSPADGQLSHPGARSAERKAIKDSVLKLRNFGAEQGLERFYFFFSGHGFQVGTDTVNSAQDLLVTADFENLNDSGDVTIQLGELLAVMTTMGPGDQYYFIDACRNQVSREQLSVGHLGINKAPPRRGTPSQFTLFSTMGGRTAKAPTPFVKELVAGLRGGGLAKKWSQQGELVVSFESLSRAVIDKVIKATGQRPATQTVGESPGELVVLYPPGPEPLVPCTITVSGVAATDTLTATAYWMTQKVEAQQPLPGGKGTLQLLTARPYTIKVTSSRHEITPASLRVPMFEPQEVEFRAGFVAFNHRGVVTRGTTTPVLFHAPARNPLTSVLVTCHTVAANGTPTTRELPARPAWTEPSAVVVSQLVNRGWHTRQLQSELKSRQDLWLASLPAGTHRIRLLEAGRALDEQELTLTAIEPAPVLPEVRFDLPAVTDPAHQELLTALRSDVQSELGEHVESSANQSLSVLLALIAMDLAWPQAAQEPFLSAALPTAASCPGLLVLVVGSGLPQGEVRSQDGTTRYALDFRPHPKARSLYSAFVDLPAGNYQAAVSLPADRYQVPLTVLPDHLTCIVAAAPHEAREIYQLYILPARSAEPRLHPQEIADFDRLEAARILESAQWLFDRQLPLPTLRWTNPLLLAMQAYTLVRRGEAGLQEAQAQVTQLGSLYPQLPDAAVLARLLDDAPVVPPGPPLFRAGLLTLSEEQQQRLSCPDSRQLSWNTAFTRWYAPAHAVPTRPD